MPAARWHFGSRKPMPTPSVAAFLDHSGDCAALLRAGHCPAWPQACTPQSWPSELRQMTSLILGAVEPMFIAWGPGRSMIYNDACIAIFGDRHPAALGGPLSDVWPRGQDDIGQAVERGFAGHSVQMNDVVLHLQRGGTRSAAYFSLGCHPIRNEDGAVTGVFCTCRETTSHPPKQRFHEDESARKRHLFDQAPGFIAILRGAQHEFEFVNRAYASAFGPRQFVGLSAAQVYPEAAAEGFIGLLDLVRTSGQRHEGLHASGVIETTTRPGEMQRLMGFIYEPLRDADQNVSGILIQGHDVSELLQSREHLRAANMRYATLLDSMGEGLVMLDAEFRVTQVNGKGLRMDGRTARQIVGLSYWDAWPGAVGTPVEHALREALASGEPRRLQHCYEWEDGRQLWFDIRALPVPGGLAVLFRNISGIKSVDESLHVSEQRFKAAVSAIGVMWTNNALGQMEGEQPGWAEITGQTPEQYQGFGWTAALHPDDAVQTLQCWQRAMVEQRNFECEHRVRRCDGQWRRYAVRAVPVLTADNVLREWVGVHIDVTEARQDAETLRAADQRKDEFLAVLAHELRNPLAPIRSAAHSLGNPALTPSDLTACRDIIQRQTRHMALLLDDLLDVSRITAGRLELKKSYTRLSDVVSAAVETARPLLDACGHSLAIELPGQDVEIEVDDLRLSQVLSNLLINAAKYTDSGGRLSLVIRADANELLIEVGDDGIGIAVEHLAHVFDMFSQLRTGIDRTQGGLGIGLALSRGLVELHGGRLEASSPGLGCGATFSVRLPAALMDSRPAVLAELGIAGAPPTALTILIADDNIDAAQSLAMLLGMDGHDVQVASNGLAALKLAARVRPDVAILDIGMPVLDGHEVARRIRLEAWGVGMLIMAVTGWGQQADQRRAVDAGFDCHFTKPVDPTELIDAIAGWRGKQEGKLAGAV